MSVEQVGIAVKVTYNSTTLAGLIQDFSGSIEPGYTAEARNRLGQVKEAKQGDWTASCDITILADSADDMPPRGATVTISGAKNDELNAEYSVTSLGETQSQQDYVSRSYSIQRYLDNGVVADNVSTTTTTTTT